MAQQPIRVHLAGRVSVEAGGALLDQAQLPGQQGRLAFAYLVAERGRPIGRGELIELLWPGDPPASAEAALSAIISKIRSALGRIDIESAALMSAPGCYELRLPPDAWIDLEAAADAIHDAEAALRAGDPGAAYGPSAVAHHIARRPLLPGEEGAWLDGRRAQLRSILLRALECRAEVYLWNREYALASEAARELVRLEPLRESGHRLLMRALATSGNSAEALQVYEDCRRLIASTLGVSPSPETKDVYERVLQAL